MKIYKLKAFNDSRGFTIEEAFFTNKNKAISSFDVLSKHLTQKYNLSAANSNLYGYNQIKGEPTLITYSFFDEPRMTVSLVEHDVKSNVIKYI